MAMIAVEATRILVPVTVATVALAAAAVTRRRRPDAPTQGFGGAPTQLDRADFAALHARAAALHAPAAASHAPWLVAVFTSATCDTCADIMRKASVLRSASVDVVEIEYTANKDLHSRYKIEAVPIVVVADESGSVAASHLGPVRAQDLWAMVADCRAHGRRIDRGGECQRT